MTVNRTKKILSKYTIDRIAELWDNNERQILEFQQGKLRVTLEDQIMHYFGHLYLRFGNDINAQLIAMATTIKDNFHLLQQIKAVDEFSKKLIDHETNKKRNSATVDGTGAASALNLKNVNQFAENLTGTKNRVLDTTRSTNLEGLEESLWQKDNKDLKNHIEINLKSIDSEKRLELFASGAKNMKERLKNIKGFFNALNVPEKVVESNSNLIKISEEVPVKVNNPSPTGITTTLNTFKERNYTLNSSGTDSVSINQREHTTEGYSWTEANAIIKTLTARLPKLRDQYWTKLLIWFSECPSNFRE